MTNNKQHTPEPWEFFTQPDEFRLGDGLDYSIMANGNVIILLACPGEVDERFKANARRIVACVNACKGAPTPIVPYLDVVEERDQYKALCVELLAALVELDRQIHQFCEEEGEWDFYTGDSEKAIQHAKEVLK